MLISRRLEEASFVNGFSTRLGGVSPFPKNSLNLAGFDEDTRENIIENRRRFLSLFEGEFQLATAWQVHGDTVKVVRTDNDVGNSEDRADALVSSLSGVLVGVKTADCVPILIGDPITGAFASVHAGWRGTARSIAAKTVMKMTEIFGSNPNELIAAIGPAACGKNYEIGQEVIDEFDENTERYFMPTRPGHALVDLHMANRDQLIGAGVRDESVSIAPFCTMERTDLFFSYRIEKKTNGRTGRLLSVIGRSGLG